MNRNRLRALAAVLIGFPLLAMSAHCQSYPAGTLPNPKLSPGATAISAVTHKQVEPKEFCVMGYSKKIRNVPTTEKNQVYQEYGITSRKPGQYEVDHIISLELGGSNDIKNLWPQSYLTKPYNAHVKDAVENQTHALICSGKMDFRKAQHDISTDWVALGKREGVVK